MVGRLLGRLVPMPAQQLADVAPLALAAVGVGQQREIADSERRPQRIRRARMHLVVQLAAQWVVRRQCNRGGVGHHRRPYLQARAKQIRRAGRIRASGFEAARVRLLDCAAMPDPAPTRASGRRSPHAVVIGSGLGGLAAAVRLGARGYRVTVLEQLDAPGGRAYVFRQDGFTFDAGPTIITAPFLLEELWELCGRRLADDVELKSLDAVLPHPLSRRRRSSSAPPTMAPMAAQINAALAGRSRRLPALHEVERSDLRDRLRAAGRGAVRFDRRHGEARAGAAAAAELTAASTAWCPTTSSIRGCASR